MSMMVLTLFVVQLYVVVYLVHTEYSLCTVVEGRERGGGGGIYQEPYYLLLFPWCCLLIWKRDFDRQQKDFSIHFLLKFTGSDGVCRMC